jgi:hypothetical protein
LYREIIIIGSMDKKIQREERIGKLVGWTDG